MINLSPIKNTGGPAFPAEATNSTFASSGMTLRDYFAAKAMQAMVGSQWPDSNDRPEIGKRSYQMADAMLKARTA